MGKRRQNQKPIQRWIRRSNLLTFLGTSENALAAQGIWKTSAPDTEFAEFDTKVAMYKAPGDRLCLDTC